MKRLFTAALLLMAGFAAALATNSKQSVTQVTSAVTLTADVDYHITGTEPFATDGSIDIVNTEHAVIIFDALRPSMAKDFLANVKINGEEAKDGTNCQLKLYDRGAILLPYGGSTFRPLTVYSEQNFGGESESQAFTEGHSGGFMKNVTTAWNNRIQSFRLKRGYMVTFALKKGGYGYSRCFIAADADLEVNLPILMAGRISSYRIFKWYDASKKGIADWVNADACKQLDCTSTFTWSAGSSLLPDVEVIPHHIYENWPSPSDLGKVTYSCHMKTNNEPANTADDPKGREESVDEVLANWEALMATGMRLCSPSSWDGSDYWNGEGRFIKPFLDSIDARGWRCDIVDAHCYWPTGNFQYLQSKWVANYKRPVWVTEWCWGASWNNNGSFSGSETEQSFKSAIQNITTTMNNSDGVERYFYWNGENGSYPCKLVRDGALTPAGEYYATMNTGLAYNGKYDYVPKAPRLYKPSDLEATFNANKMTCTLKWTSKNGDLANTVQLQRRANSGRWETISEWLGGDLEDQTAISYVDNITEAASYEYRVVESMYNNTTLTSASVFNVISTSAGSADFQYGTITSIKEDENITFFAYPFEEEPIIILGDPSYAAISVTQNLMSISMNSERTHYANFKMRYRLWESDSENTKTNKMTTTYIAAKAGRGKFGSLNYEAGRINNGSSVNCKTEYQVTFSEPFATVPVVLATPKVSNANITAVMWRIYDVTTEGFKIQLLKESSITNKVAGPCSFIAIEPGQGWDGENTIITVGAQEATFSSLAQTFELGEGIELENARIMTQLQTNNNEAAANTRYTGTTATSISSFSARMAVDKSDTEKVLSLTNKTDECLGYIIFSDGQLQENSISSAKNIAPVSSLFTTLSGLHVNQPTRPGIYIIDGKKVVLK